MTQEERQNISYILSQILSSLVKEEDAPCASGSHMATALTELLMLLEFNYDFEPDNEYDNELKNYLSYSGTFVPLELCSKYLGEDVTQIEQFKNRKNAIQMFELFHYKQIKNGDFSYEV